VTFGLSNPRTIEPSDYRAATFVAYEYSILNATASLLSGVQRPEMGLIDYLGHPERQFPVVLCFTADVSFFKREISELRRPIATKLC